MRTPQLLAGDLRLLCVLGVVGLGCDGGPAKPRHMAPTVTILSPSVSTFTGGDSIDVLITATDPDDGVLPATAMSWWVVLHHAAHTHPYRPVTDGAIGQFEVSRAGHDDHDIFLRVYARAVDGDGDADTAFVDLAPALTTLTVASVPTGLTVLVDGQPHLAPYVTPAVVGMERAVGAAGEQTLGSVIYRLNAWSDAGDSLHSIVVPSTPVVFTATYDSIASTNAVPTATLLSPTAGTVVSAGADVVLSATAADSDGSIAAVTFLENGVPIGSDGSAPFSITWIPSALGERHLSARATDVSGASGESPVVTVMVQAASAPLVTLDSPTDGTRDLVGAVLLQATATDDGSVSFVEFEVDGVPLATDSVAPYEATLPSTTAHASGAHVVRARARDDDGNYSVWTTARVTFGGSVALPAGFTRTTVASGLGAVPTAIAVAPDGRLFVTEQTGAVRVIKNDVLLAEPFVTIDVEAVGELGLLGIALDPAFSSNSWVYLYHTVADEGRHNRIIRLTADGDLAASGSAVVLVDLPLLGTSGKHSGGAMRFDTEGKLLVATGDDSHASHAPSLASPFGKLLRFAKDGTIPTDNPFYGVTAGVNRAIWARGLRNPFTFDVDTTSGRIHINDVGQSAWEEINVGRAGANYGWPLTEGPTSSTGVDAPLLAYAHFNSPTMFEGFAAVGAAFYRPAVPMFGSDFVGDYFFADYVNRWIYRLDHDAQWAPYMFASLDGPITGLAVGVDGALYVLVGNRVDRIRF